MEQHINKSALEGIDVLKGASIPSKLAALRDAVLELGTSPENVAAKLSQLGPDERGAVEQMLRLAAELPAILSRAQRGLDGAVSKTQWGSVHRVEPQPPGEILPIPQRAAFPIALSEILFVTKQSKVEWDMAHTGLSFEALVKRYEEFGEDKDRIVGSHMRQRKTIEEILAIVSVEQVIPNKTLTPEIASKYKLLVAVGGDDHFKFVSHRIDNDTPILGLNSDAATSEGNILDCTAAELPRVLGQISAGKYRLEPWTRLRLAIDGKDIGPALGDIVLGKCDFRLMSRHDLDTGTDHAAQKSSGLLISTGTGSTGWFASAGLYLYPLGRPFAPTAPYARFELREPFPRFAKDAEGVMRAVYPPLTEGVLAAGEKLVVKSFNNSDGIGSRDSLDSVPFERGRVAEVTIDPKPLWVLRPVRP